MAIFNTVYGGEPKYIYTYDFRNKTVSQLTTDGWLNVSSATVDSDGIYVSSWTSVSNEPSGLLTAMSNAKTLTLKCNAKVVLTTSGVVGGFNLVSSASNANQTGMYGQPGATFEVKVANTSVTKPSYSPVSGDMSTTYTIDFANKTLNYNFGGNTGTYTLTDAQISGVRQCYRIYCPLDREYIKDISVIIGL